MGRDPNGCAEQIGTGPIADEVLSKYLDCGDLIGMVFDGDGQPLWLGRKRRNASTGQYLALVVRDKGCVLCDASATKCESHHLTPWNAPARGKTNINELALLCPSCHDDLHHRKQTLEPNPDAPRTWQTRPATPNELPPARKRAA